MITLPTTLKSQLAAACYTLGLALAVYLTLLKFFALPCIGPGSCQAILYSKYGSVFRVPVGVYGALLWLGVIFVPNQEKRDVLLFMLAVGTALFMAIQFFVLRGFCLYCTLHAIAAWGAMILHNQRPRFWMAALALFLAGGGFLLAREHAEIHARDNVVQAAKLANLADNISALPWLGAIHPRSPALVLSLDCAACLDLLEKLTQENYRGRDFGPALYLKTNDANRALTLEFVAAVLTQRELTRREALLATSTVLLMEKENTLSNPNAAATRLAAMFPASAEKKADAERIIAAQAKTLATINPGDTTPLLIARDGSTQAILKTAELFP